VFHLPIGVPELFLIVVVLGGPVMWFGWALKRRATRLGYPSRSAYVRAAPRSDAERRDAVDLALKGLVFCVLGLIFPPFILVGLIPLFYGGRKLAYASMGLGLVDDEERPHA
jgi:hypothetical protein